jgi:hypothetical protein
MKLLVYIQAPINKIYNILISICIWMKGTSGKNIISSQKWATQLCIYLLVYQHELFSARKL